MKINYGFIVRDKDNEFLHFCGYEEEPSELDLKQLKIELSVNTEFGLTELIDSATISLATKEEVVYYGNMISSSKKQSLFHSLKGLIYQKVKNLFRK